MIFKISHFIGLQAQHLKLVVMCTMEHHTNSAFVKI